MAHFLYPKCFEEGRFSKFRIGVTVLRSRSAFFVVFSVPSVPGVIDGAHLYFKNCAFFLFFFSDDINRCSSPYAISFIRSFHPLCESHRVLNTELTELGDFKTSAFFSLSFFLTI